MKQVHILLLTSQVHEYVIGDYTSYISFFLCEAVYTDSLIIAKDLDFND